MNSTKTITNRVKPNLNKKLKPNSSSTNPKLLIESRDDRYTSANTIKIDIDVNIEEEDEK